MNFSLNISLGNDDMKSPAFVASLLHEAGFKTFSAVSPFLGADGRWHLQKPTGQVCILHEEGALNAAIAS